MKIDILQSCGHCWASQICWHFECTSLTESCFRIWNSSAGILSPPLALFTAMLLKAHLTSHSRMSGSRWVTTPLWLSGSLRPFLYSPYVYSCHLLLISSASVNSLPFLFFIIPILEWNIALMSPIFLKRSLVFPILLFSSISLHCSFKKDFLSLLAILWNSAFSWVYLFLSPLPCVFLLSSAICKALQTTALSSCISFLGNGFGHCLLYSVMNLHLQFFRHCLPDLIPWIYLILHCTIIRNWFRS